MKGNFGDLLLKPLLLCCDSGNREIDSADKLAEQPFFENIEIALSESAFSRGCFRKVSGFGPVHLSADFESFQQRLELFDLIIVSPLSLNTLAKFALGIRDSFPSKILGKAVGKNIPILLDSAEIPARDSDLNSHFIKIYRRYWDDLLLGTIRGFSWDRFSETMAAIVRQKRQDSGIKTIPGRCVITRDDILSARECLGVLKIPRGAIVTDLAREDAVRWGVKIETE